ncbi:MAG TPA: hypothetical protein VKC34_10315 [Blastocatellia bacterium]|nr:hypothetical protein [Blastocatellia bacterium]
MADKIKRDALLRRWTHSWEEDANKEQVFRPEGYDFKLSRRPRESFELRPDGTLILGEPSASDSLRESRGRWEIVGGDKLVFHSGAKPEPEKKMQIKSVSDDRLVVQVES